MPVDLCRQARALGIRRFIFVSSIHALDHSNRSDYATSKRLAVERLSDISGIEKWGLYLPAVVGGELAGRLALVSRLPGFLQELALLSLRSLKPTVSIARITETILDLPETENPAITLVIVADDQSANNVYRTAKRFIDIVFSLSIIVLLWWAMLIIWAAIRLQSPGPGIFLQDRIGRNEQVFTCLKFRTMYVSAPNVGTHEVPAAAVTPLGHFLRRTKLDELPQVINILRNDMSLVGPRPCLPNQANMIIERRARRVFEIKPGITGLAQVRGIDMSDPAGLATCDHEYLQLQSLLLDFKIILQTARGAGSGDKISTAASSPDESANPSVKSDRQ
ncbi:sugar transferase [Devosia sp. MC521]|nr:sugar transferase [Devosia sp. MC521]QMW64420.1 sugar transferase [Devosia sp. MC521]